jgi:threonine aldolase
MALGLDEIDGLEIAWDRLNINMVFFSLEEKIDLASALEERGIIINPEEDGEYRFVTHIGVGKEDVDRLLVAMKEILQ